MLNVFIELWGMRWMGHLALLDGEDQLEQGCEEHRSVVQWLLSQLE